MKPLIFLIVLLIFLFIVFLIYIRGQTINNRIMKKSEKIASITKLNKDFNFHNVESNITINKHYDNKENFNRIEPAYIMSAYLRDNVVVFSQFISHLKENRNTYKQYKEKLFFIISSPPQIDYKQTKIFKREFQYREKKLIKSIVLKPPINCKINVIMTYFSQKDYVKLSKANSFSFIEVFTAFESISRTYLDRDVYEKLVAVERGEVSDSLRYDIFKRDNFKCVICGGSSKDGVRLHLDHILPISKGGRSNIENLRTLCERCNVGKSDKLEN